MFYTLFKHSTAKLKTQPLAKNPRKHKPRTENTNPYEIVIFQLPSPSATYSCGSSSVPLLPTSSCGTDIDQWASIMEEILFLFLELSSNPSNCNAQVQVPFFIHSLFGKPKKMKQNKFCVFSVLVFIFWKLKGSNKGIGRCWVLRF